MAATPFMTTLKATMAAQAEAFATLDNIFPGTAPVDEVTLFNMADRLCVISPLDLASAYKARRAIMHAAKAA